MGFDIFIIIATIPGVVVGLSMHEFGHAIVADKLGDPTPRSEGRLTISPVAHLDLLGLIFFCLAGFGWAKPVNTQPRYFRHPLRDQLLVAFAGVGMNLLVAIIFIMISAVFSVIHLDKQLGMLMTAIITTVLALAIRMNLVLLVFNLLPIAPLDGFRILSGIMPMRFYNVVNFLGQYGQNILMILIVLSFLKIPILSYLIGTPVGWIESILNPIFYDPIVKILGA